MTRAAMSRGGIALVLIVAGVYVLLGGDLDLGSDGTATTTEAETTTTTAPPDENEVAPAPEGEDSISAQEAAEIDRVLALVEAGGPFPHDQDGETFQNREGLLPERPVGYYREYTCETPGSEDRGARRLVIGSGGETYYTEDHYQSFTEIDPADYG